MKYNDSSKMDTMPTGCKFCSHGHCMNPNANFHCQYEEERKKWLKENPVKEIEISPEDLAELKRIVEKSKIV